jgi:hypothetical protein
LSRASNIPEINGREQFYQALRQSLWRSTANTFFCSVSLLDASVQSFLMKHFGLLTFAGNRTIVPPSQRGRILTGLLDCILAEFAFINATFLLLGGSVALIRP